MARLIGILYLIVVVTEIFGLAYFPTKLCPPLLAKAEIACDF